MLKSVEVGLKNLSSTANGAQIECKRRGTYYGSDASESIYGYGKPGVLVKTDLYDGK
jgi:hypothetical protein